MSRKSVTTICKSKQIPRIFQRRSNQSAVYTGGGGRCVWDNSGGAFADDSTAHNSQHRGNSLLDCNDEKRASHSYRIGRETENVFSDGVCCRDVDASAPVTIDNGRSAEEKNTADTVADIEKWLKTRTESVSSMDLDTMKSVVGEEEEEEDVDDDATGVSRYLVDNLTHSFLDKENDALSIDMDLTDKKLNLDYDPILRELRGEKLLDECDKSDDFALPEFRLDHLDPMALTPDDMMVAGEILPSLSNEPEIPPASDREEELAEENDVRKETGSMQPGEALRDEADKGDDIRRFKEEPEEIEETETTEDDGNYYLERIAQFLQVEETTQIAAAETSCERRKLKKKSEPRIMKRGTTKANGRIESQGAETKDGGIMAVVAISTDKISNMTQIVINNGKEEQIYQGKTSELIEATGNFPKLPRIDASGDWSNGGEDPICTQNETAVSNALKELGVTDDCLQPSVVNENGRIWVCPRDDCSREFTKLHTLKGHLLAHYGVRPFKCDFQGCAWAFHSEFKLKRHKETHLKRKDFVCEVAGCNRRFTTVYNLWSHEKLHTRPNRIICQVPDCQEKFQTKRALELHMKTHDQSHAPYVCSRAGCGKRYYSSNALTSHQRCHSYKEIDVKCSWPGCGKIFDKPCRLKAHIRSHTGCKPYTCTYRDCQWAFSSSSKLKRHEKKHTNERKFLCDIDGCGKAFLRSEHLKEHSLTHKEGRYFQCHMCDARFSAKSTLYVHIKKHQIRDAVDTITIENYEITDASTRETRGVEENLVNEDSSNIEGFYVESSSVAEDDRLDSTTACYVRSSSDVHGRDETEPDYYICGVDDCAKSYKAQSSLREHMHEMHGNPIEDGDKSSIGVGDPRVGSVKNMDYVLYTTPSAMVRAMSRRITINEADVAAATSSGSSLELVECPPEPEPPPRLDENSSIEQCSYHPSVDNFTFDQRANTTSSVQGSARTGLTRTDVWRLKASATRETTPVGASDVVLGTADLTEGLLLTEELPSMYYHDDMVGTECQILLLDSTVSESAIHLRGLE